MRLTFPAHEETDQIPYSETHAAQGNIVCSRKPMLLEHLDCDNTFISDSSAVRIVLVKYAIQGRRLLYAQGEGLIPIRTRCPLFQSGSVALFVIHSDDCKHKEVGLYTTFVSKTHLNRWGNLTSWDQLRHTNL